ncbi:MAG: PQQ-binding-like beta-propeller repeat protein [bacterium]|nr:PQQ-binding-like beta-propeller repeat protein [bacterium]
MMKQQRWINRLARFAGEALRVVIALVLAGSLAGLADAARDGASAVAVRILSRIEAHRGLCVLLGKTRPNLGVELARGSELLFYIQTADADDARAIRQAASVTGLLGKRLFVDEGAEDRIGLADNLADAVYVAPATGVSKAEVLRVLRPGGKAFIGQREIVKPLPKGTDEWSHPYHGPDNNPQSADRLARYPYLTQFLADPLFSSQPEVTVTAGGRIFKAFGHMAFREYQNIVINKLYAFSAYNGTLLWTRPLKEGFMIHRNTMIATADLLYLADDESCKLLDAATGVLKGEIRPPVDVAGGSVWKWMALQDGVLYALLGGEEVPAPVALGRGRLIAGWPWAMWPGYDYKDPERSWGIGRTFLAMNPKTGEILWSYRDEGLVDSRGVCLSGGRLYFCHPGKFIGCLETATGNVLWRRTDANLLEALGVNGPAQNPWQGFATSVYVRTDGKRLLFAGPQRPSLVSVATKDGGLQWARKDGNFQLVLREDAIYAAGRQMTKSYKFNYATGDVLAEFVDRRSCTRATGSLDSVFFRAKEGTVRWIPETNSIEHIAPMRPGCHDGVIISDGHLYWGPWICGCHLSLIGLISLGPAGDFNYSPPPNEAHQLRAGAGNLSDVRPLAIGPTDWLEFQADPRRSCQTRAPLPAAVAPCWSFQVPSAPLPTAPVIAGGLVFTAGLDGVVRAVDAATGRQAWQAFTGGSIFFPPAISENRAYVGSNDGRVYCFEAATGRELWRFRVGPADRKILAYGDLISTWPVAGGVVVRDGTAYAAAGIAHYDGTHVYALDALTGKVKWHNSETGTLDPNVRNGISVCGNLKLDGAKLSFPGGNVYATAEFDAATGKCLNQPAGPKTQRRILLFPRRVWEPIMSNVQETPKGQIRVFHQQMQSNRALVSSGSYHLGLYNVPPGTPLVRSPGPVAGPGAARAPRSKPVWSLTLSEYQGSILAGDALLVLGRWAENEITPGNEPSLIAIRITDGKTLWTQSLTAAPVPWGVALDGAGRIVVSLENGTLECFAPAPADVDEG